MPVISSFLVSQVRIFQLLRFRANVQLIYNNLIAERPPHHHETNTFNSSRYNASAIGSNRAAGERVHHFRISHAA
jgi:hypothetical protein